MVRLIHPNQENRMNIRVSPLHRAVGANIIQILRIAVIAAVPVLVGLMLWRSPAYTAALLFMAGAVIQVLRLRKP